MAETGFDYDNTLTSDPRSRERLTIAAAYMNVALRGAPSMDELKDCYNGPITVTRARAFAAMMNLAFAFEVALKGKVSEDRLENIPVRDRHNLKVLFENMPKVEQDQLRMCVKDILLINESEFDDLLDLCKLGFKEWRYFYEKQYAGRTYAYFHIVGFLYASVYYLICGEGKGHLLEESGFRRLSYIRESGLVTQFHKTVKEFEEAKEISLKDGHGQISDADNAWLQSILDRLNDIVNQVGVVAKQYDEGRTDFNKSEK